MTMPYFVARPLIAVGLQTSPQSWKKRAIAHDSPHVHARGTNPDRVLLVGDGAATGRGVTTHELGLPGYLARGLSALTGHATDVDIIVDQDMTVVTSASAIKDVNLRRYDTIVLSVGHNEALTLMRAEKWREAITDLLDDLDLRTGAAVPVSILAIPEFGPKTEMPTRLATIIDRKVARLNNVTAEVIADRPDVTLITAEARNEFEPETTKVYKRWADNVAGHITASFAADRVPAGDTVEFDEMQRQLALENLEASGTGDGNALDDLMTSARAMFATPLAAITLVHSDMQTFQALQGAERMEIPRNEAFCDVTIRRASHLVIEDASADPRYADFGVVAGAPGVKFYAGYPIESPDGHRVGAFCVMDTKTRQFSHEDLTMLRSMAQLAQDRLWPAA